MSRQGIVLFALEFVLLIESFQFPFVCCETSWEFETSVGESR